MEKNRQFYQSKFEYYRTMNMWIVIACCLSSISYVVSDWHIFKEINTTTIPARTAILIPFVLFMIVNAHVHDYRIMVPMSYLVAHSIMWCTIWACWYLPDLTFASDGFIIIMSVFIFFGFAAPAEWSMLLTGLIFVDIGIANTFLHYPEFAMMLILGIPFYVGICIVDWAVERSYMYQYQAKKMLEESAFHDQLTGIYNRNIIERIIDEKGRFQCFAQGELSIFLFDIDLFKAVNDAYGHDAGDVVLKEVVNLAADQLDVPHYLLRWGGEEFLVLVNEPLERAVRRAEQIRCRIEKEACKVCPVTISIGVTSYTGGEYKTFVRQADQALYEAKNEGRNRVHIYGD